VPAGAAPDATAPDAPLGWLDRLFPPTRAGAVRLALAVHVAVLALATVVGVDAQGTEQGVDLWRRWDTTHYVRIADAGYPGRDEEGGPLMSAFLPLYPLAIRVLALATGSFVVAALLVSAGATLVASACLFEIVARDADPGTARRAVAWLNLYPTSFFLVAGYTEALFLALVLASLLAARDDRFGVAAIAAACAGAARITGVALLPALALETWLVTRERRDRRFARRLAVVAAVAPIGIAAYLAMNLAVYGHAFEFLRHQARHWQHVPSTPWTELEHAWSTIANDPATVERAVLVDAPAATILILAATAGFAALRLRASYAVYALGGAWLATAVTWNISAPRYALAVWPLFWMLAVLLRRRWLAVPLAALSGALLAAIAIRFMNDLWVF